VRLSPLGTSATIWPIVVAPDDGDEYAAVGGMIGRGIRNTRRKPAPVPLCPPQIPYELTRARTRTAVVRSQRLTAWAVARHINLFNSNLTPWSESASELYRPSDRSFSAKCLPTFADKGCHVVSVTDPSGRISQFSRQEPLLFYQVAPQLYSRGWVDPVPDPLLFSFFSPRKSGSAGNRTRASGSIAKNSDH
jgi:hypothetical protein